jgi:hypothetical protein
MKANLLLCTNPQQTGTIDAYFNSFLEATHENFPGSMKAAG